MLLLPHTPTRLTCNINYDLDIFVSHSFTCFRQEWRTLPTSLLCRSLRIYSHLALSSHQSPLHLSQPQHSLGLPELVISGRESSCIFKELNVPETGTQRVGGWRREKERTNLHYEWLLTYFLSAPRFSSAIQKEQQLYFSFFFKLFFFYTFPLSRFPPFPRPLVFSSCCLLRKIFQNKVYFTTNKKRVSVSFGRRQQSQTLIFL